jgi:hypothetical protein
VKNAHLFVFSVVSKEMVGAKKQLESNTWNAVDEQGTLPPTG